MWYNCSSVKSKTMLVHLYVYKFTENNLDILQKLKLMVQTFMKKDLFFTLSSILFECFILSLTTVLKTRTIYYLKANSLF